jgi:UDP-3-O-[3-hydroxymyristoyl] N-acetylglucosamine deacetylase
MSFTYPIGRIVAGDPHRVRTAVERFHAQAVDHVALCAGETGYSPRRTTLGQRESVSGPGTFTRRTLRTLTFAPGQHPGWWIKRTDLDEQLDVGVSPRNIWTSQRNIVLRSGSPHNYLRMVEHIVALRLGLGIDDLVVETGSGDPPLFDRSSLDLVEAVERAGIVERDEPARYVTVKEPVTIGGDRGDFITILPAEKGVRRLRLDCAINFSSVIGKQRLVYDLTPETFRTGAFARTNASQAQRALALTVGLLFADTRNLGYTNQNILIHGKKRYLNEPHLLQPDGRSLEPVWHRATLDLLAALALIDCGRLAGTVVSYRAGHTLDCRLMTLLYRHDLLTTC